MTIRTYTIHTDGSCLNNGSPFAIGGFGAVLRRDDGAVLEVAGRLNDSVTPTSVRAEMTAAIRALSRLKDPSIVTLCSDNEMLVRGCNEWLPGWKAENWRKSKKNPVKNVDLWEILDALLQRHKVQSVWIKGHGGNPDNERADQLASLGVHGKPFNELQDLERPLI
ncbi:ribonuclease HI [Pseudomonas seleniipraecipitans]|uniref:ribonuclease H n=1 Tax=Phytopseudomonas seleniipraecipitans TaxID=640205 RepID=A0ABY5JGD4_9GAMM|nr:ribonuclease H [Pseudomonas seleniipraecipitans]UUD65723.1 ribonuclease HI [Pseudomonas seleniipraecipitans]